MTINLPLDHLGLKTRACIDCGEVKSPEAFSLHKHKSHYGGYAALTRCKLCHSIYKNKNHLFRKYGVSPDDYEKMLVDQNYKCALCGGYGSGVEERFVVDHCHTTGKVRGLLCWPCNIGIGMFRDSPELLKQVIDYLNIEREI
jgi:hypothetical protein